MVWIGKRDLGACVHVCRCTCLCGEFQGFRGRLAIAKHLVAPSPSSRQSRTSAWLHIWSPRAAPGTGGPWPLCLLSCSVGSRFLSVPGSSGLGSCKRPSFRATTQVSLDLTCFLFLRWYFFLQGCTSQLMAYSPAFPDPLWMVSCRAGFSWARGFGLATFLLVPSPVFYQRSVESLPRIPFNHTRWPQCMNKFINGLVWLVRRIKPTEEPYNGPFLMGDICKSVTF